MRAAPDALPVSEILLFVIQAGHKTNGSSGQKVRLLGGTVNCCKKRSFRQPLDSKNKHAKEQKLSSPFQTYSLRPGGPCSGPSSPPPSPPSAGTGTPGRPTCPRGGNSSSSLKTLLLRLRDQGKGSDEIINVSLFMQGFTGVRVFWSGDLRWLFLNTVEPMNLRNLSA